MHHARWPRARGAATGVVLIALVGAVAALAPVSPSAAQEPCDPIYGCEPEPPDEVVVEASCETSSPDGAAGARVDVVVRNVRGGTPVELRLNGEVVAGGTADPTAPGQAPAGYADVPLSFEVPPLPPGGYPLEATGPALSVACGENGQFVVAGVAGVRIEQDVSRSGGGRSGAGALARTGAQLALLLVIAAGLLVVGRIVQRHAGR